MRPRAWGPLGRNAPPAGFGGSSAWAVDQRPQTQTKTAVSEAPSVSCAAAAPVSSATHGQGWDVQEPGRGPHLSITG